MAVAVASYLPPGLPAPAPAVDGLDTEYWEGAKRHELMVQCCNACGRVQWGPEWVCHYCHSFDLGWKQIEGKGKIWSWERVWHPVHPALAEGCPYIVVLVELEEHDNIRMVGNLLGDPEQPVIIGQEVEAVFEDHGEGEDAYTLVQWKAASQ